jgi:phosphoglycerate dehydrogenase-like enzyme
MPNPRPQRPVVLFLWPPADALRERLEQGTGNAVELVFPKDREAVAETLAAWAPRAEVVVGWRPEADFLAAADKLELIINPGAGVQHLSPLLLTHNETRARPITLVNGHGNSYFTAQGAVALLLALCNRVVLHHNGLCEGRWRTGDGEGATWPLQDRRVGLLGYGAVNRWVHRFLSGFDLEFAALRRHWPQVEREAGPGEPPHRPPSSLARFTTEQLPEFLDDVDTVVTALPLTPQTEGMLDAEALRRLGPRGLLVHTARGPIADEAALYETLAEGRILGAAIDVWWDYAPQPDAQGRRYPYDAQRHPFHELPNVVLSPHRAASPFGDLGRWEEVVENLRRFAANEPLLNVVDLEHGY